MYESSSEVDLDDILSNGIQHIFLALGHPVPQLSEVYLVCISLLLLEVLLEDDLKVLQIREDVVEGVANDQHGEGVVQLVAFSVGFVFQGFTEDSEDVNGGFAVGLLEGAVKGLVFGLRTK